MLKTIGTVVVLLFCALCGIPTAAATYDGITVSATADGRSVSASNSNEPIRLRPVSERILQHNCLNCHRDLVGGILGHGSADEMTNCVHCHAAVGHGPQR